MRISRQIFLLFLLNFLDAVFTIYWIRNGFATEGNHLMGSLLEIGDLPFLTVKLLVGATAAVVLSRWAHLRVARYGLILALTVYVGLMGIHLFTGLSAFGFISPETVNHFSSWANNLFALFI